MVANGRIGYIDAMRGFTMILVVYTHICHFCLGDSFLGFNPVFILFRLPCFFMLSGWLFERVALRPFAEIARHKARVQLVPTFFFLFLLCPPPDFFHQLGSLKGGYWFTFVLFEFFIIYMLIVRKCRRYGFAVALLLSVLCFFYDAYRNDYFTRPGFSISAVLGFFSFPLWRFFLFFYLGAWMRRHFDAFLRWTDQPLTLLALTIVFSFTAAMSRFEEPYFEILRFYIGGIAGMWLIFTCFRGLYSQPLVRSSVSSIFHLPSSILRFIGTRTLDIYLLHYFFLPRFLSSYTGWLRSFNSPIVEFLYILAVSLCVLALSLLVSYVIRLSPVLAYYLFGVKRPQDIQQKPIHEL